MMNSSNIESYLQILGFSGQEASIYRYLLATPQNHLALSRATGINRTTIYRLVDSLSERGIVTTVTGERGPLLQASPIDSLDRLIEENRAKLDQQKEALDSLRHLLPTLQQSDSFSVRTHQGKESVKQLLWKELSNRGEILVFSHDQELSVALGKRFAQSFRREIVKRKICQRALQNDQDSLENYAEPAYAMCYKSRIISPKILKITQELSILSSSVHLYNWEKDVYIGIEIKSTEYALFMRNIFESFWAKAFRSQKGVDAGK